MTEIERKIHQLKTDIKESIERIEGFFELENPITISITTKLEKILALGGKRNTEFQKVQTFYDNYIDTVNGLEALVKSLTPSEDKLISRREPKTQSYISKQRRLFALELQKRERNNNSHINSTSSDKRSKDVSKGTPDTFSLEKHEFTEMLSDDGYTLKIRKQKADGDCMYHSIAFSLEKLYESRNPSFRPNKNFYKIIKRRAIEERFLKNRELSMTDEKFFSTFFMYMSHYKGQEHNISLLELDAVNFNWKESILQQKIKNVLYFEEKFDPFELVENASLKKVFTEIWKTYFETLTVDDQSSLDPANGDWKCNKCDRTFYNKKDRDGHLNRTYNLEDRLVIEKFETKEGLIHLTASKKGSDKADEVKNYTFPLANLDQLRQLLVDEMARTAADAKGSKIGKTHWGTIDEIKYIENYYKVGIIVIHKYPKDNKSYKSYVVATPSEERYSNYMFLYNNGDHFDSAFLTVRPSYKKNVSEDAKKSQYIWKCYDLPFPIKQNIHQVTKKHVDCRNPIEADFSKLRKDIEGDGAWWTCQKCTYDNELTSRQCEMCEQPM
jgi:hypothetical protein